jgi:hypothetical protein
MSKKYFVANDSAGRANALYETLSGMVHLGASVSLATGFLVDSDPFYEPVIERLLGLSDVEWVGFELVKDERTESAGEWVSGPNEWTMAGEPLPCPSPKSSKPDFREGEEAASLDTAMESGVRELPKCKNCGQPFERRRRDTLYCNEKACQKAKNREYQRLWYAKKNGSTSELMAEAAVLEQAAAVEIAAVAAAIELPEELPAVELASEPLAASRWRPARRIRRRCSTRRRQLCRSGLRVRWKNRGSSKMDRTRASV